LGVVVVPPVEELDLVGPMQVFSAANCLAGKPVYAVEVATNARDLKVTGEGGPRSKVATFVELVVMDQFGIRPLRPASWSRIEFVREDAHGNRDGDAFRIEVPFAPILPIETSARKRFVRQPGDRDVVENVVAREALGFSGQDP